MVHARRYININVVVVPLDVFMYDPETNKSEFMRKLYWYPSECDVGLGESKCLICPDDMMTNGYGTSISDCYMPAEWEASDDTGTYRYSDDCYYGL